MRVMRSLKGFTVSEAIGKCVGVFCGLDRMYPIGMNVCKSFHHLRRSTCKPLILIHCLLSLNLKSLQQAVVRRLLVKVVCGICVCVSCGNLS